MSVVGGRTDLTGNRRHFRVGPEADIRSPVGSEAAIAQTSRGHGARPRDGGIFLRDGTVIQ